MVYKVRRRFMEMSVAAFLTAIGLGGVMPQAGCDGRSTGTQQTQPQNKYSARHLTVMLNGEKREFLVESIPLADVGSLIPELASIVNNTVLYRQDNPGQVLYAQGIQGMGRIEAYRDSNNANRIMGLDSDDQLVAIVKDLAGSGYSVSLLDLDVGTNKLENEREVLKVDKEIENVILKNPVEPEIWKVARKNGMKTMREDATLKALDGIIPFEEVNKV